MVEEADQAVAIDEAVGDRLGDLRERRERADLLVLLAQPGLESRRRGPLSLLAHAAALGGRRGIDLALDGEQRIGAGHCLPARSAPW